VTNALQYLPHADNILWLEAGSIRAQGTYQQLVAQVGHLLLLPLPVPLLSPPAAPCRRWYKGARRAKQTSINLPLLPQPGAPCSACC
jgi:hypothetical protein